MYTIYLTTECNFKCTYCYEDYTHKLELSTSKLMKILHYIVEEDCSEILRICFMGGEPLLKKDLICKAVEYLNNNSKAREVRYFITTNGSLIDDSFIDFMKINNFMVRMSFDGCKECHDTNRILKNGHTQYEEIYQNILLIRDSGIKYSVRLTITDNTIKYMFKNILFLHKNKLNSICMILDINMDFTEELKKNFKEQVAQITDYYIEQYDHGDKITLDQVDGKIFNILCDFGNRFIMCDGGTSNFKIMPDGRIYPCGFVTNNPNCEIGNLETEIKQCKGKELAISFFDKKNDKCSKCMIRDFCTGMKCGYMNFVRTGAVNVPSDTTCISEKIYYDNVMKIVNHIRQKNIMQQKEFFGSYIQAIIDWGLHFSTTGKEIYEFLNQ